jgi:lipopolysaccharide/colanic/teichoic acid biosynthesis glycosyltransferase
MYAGDKVCHGERSRGSTVMSELSLLVKRILDVAGAILGLAVFAVPMVIVAGLVRLRIGSPVLYRVIRPGLHAEPFLLHKFRTMRDLTDADGRPLSDKERITPLGRFLRRTSLDELPQLVNVLNGEMSLVGPRPLKTEYLELYTPQQARRHEAKPGITGLAQIKGRNTLSWDERFALDVWYVDHASLVLDLRILLQTVGKVLRRDSISSDGDLDVPSFTGSLSGNPVQRGLPSSFS